MILRNSVLILSIVFFGLSLFLWLGYRDTEQRVDKKLSQIKQLQQPLQAVPVPSTPPVPAVIKQENARDLTRQAVIDVPGCTDLTVDYHSSEKMSVHMHIMCGGQFCPLHQHQTTTEAGLIVAGNGTVISRFGDGHIGTRQERFSIQPDDMVISPPLNAHEFINDSDSDPLAALVIATPPFRGNLYLREDEQASNQALPTRLIHLAEQTTLPVSIAPGVTAQRIDYHPDVAMQRLDISQRYESKTEGKQLYYIVKGSGTLRFKSEPPVSLQSGKIVLLQSDTELALEPEQDQTLNVLQFPLL